MSRRNDEVTNVALDRNVNQRAQGDVATPLVVRSLRVTRASREILRGIDLEVARGEVCMLMGASGSGKTTILRTIAALQAFDSGSIEVEEFQLNPGNLPRESRLVKLRRSVGMVFQSHALFEHLSAIDNVTLAPMHALGWSRERAESAGRELLRSLEVGHRADAFPRQLSGGEAQRVAIARALAPDPALLLMDEPTSSLDQSRREGLGNVLRELARAGRALLIATHDTDFANRYADRTVALENGAIV